MPASAWLPTASNPNAANPTAVERAIAELPCKALLIYSNKSAVATPLMHPSIVARTTTYAKGLSRRRVSAVNVEDLFKGDASGGTTRSMQR